MEEIDYSDKPDITKWPGTGKIHYCDEVHGMCVLLYTQNLARVASVSMWFWSKERLGMTRSVLLVTPFFARSFTLIPRSLIRNRT